MMVKRPTCTQNILKKTKETELKPQVATIKLAISCLSFGSLFLKAESLLQSATLVLFLGFQLYILADNTLCPVIAGLISILDTTILGAYNLFWLHI